MLAAIVLCINEISIKTMRIMTSIFGHETNLRAPLWVHSYTQTWMYSKDDIHQRSCCLLCYLLITNERRNTNNSISQQIRYAHRCHCKFPDIYPISEAIWSSRDLLHYDPRQLCSDKCHIRWLQYRTAFDSRLCVVRKLRTLWPHTHRAGRHTKTRVWVSLALRNVTNMVNICELKMSLGRLDEWLAWGSDTHRECDSLPHFMPHGCSFLP